MPRRTKYTTLRISSDRKRYYKNFKYPEIPLSFNDTYITTVSGDRLDLLADQFLGDVDYWWVISIANPDVIRRDSFNLKPGIEIRIPKDIENILEEFETLNKF